MKRLKPIVYWLAIAVFGGLTIISLVYVIVKTRDASGGVDFHSYWYAGHFIRQERDPYTAYVNGESPSPLAYLDAAAVEGTVDQGNGLATVPANTAPVVWLLSLFAFFSWPTAKLLWMAVNLALMALTPWLVWRLLPDKGTGLGWQGKLLLALVFWGIFGTRNIIGNGQTSLLVFVLMLVTLSWAERGWLVAGLALGVALSKYSLALPIFLLLLLERRWRVLLVALAVQALALLALAFFTGETVWEILGAYLVIFQLHTGLEGIHLASLFPGSPMAEVLADVVLSVLVFGTLLWKGFVFRRHSSATGLPCMPAAACAPLAQAHVFNVLMLWTLLVAYHRAYDTFTAILFVALAGWGLARGVWALSAGGRLAMWAALLVLVGALSLPAQGMALLAGLLPVGALAGWLDMQGRGMTLALLAMLGVSLWLLRQNEQRS